MKVHPKRCPLEAILPLALLWLMAPSPASGFAAAAAIDEPSAAAAEPIAEPSPDEAAEESDVAEVVLEAERQRVEAIGRAVPTAVSIFVPGGAGGGSGVLISPDGYALTNFHVSSPAGHYMRCGLSDGQVYDAVLVGIDPVGDLALIKLLGRDDFPYAELADSDRVRAGHWCFVVGNPFLLATNLEPSVSWGMVSGVRRYQYPAGTLLEYADCIQTDASINPGNSGGPLFDAQGRVIGIVGRGSFEKRGRINVGVGYAISVNQVKNFLGHLHSGRVLDHATLGATVVSDPDGGARVSNILESSDAYRRGLRFGNEIVELAGRPILTANDVQNILGTLPKGWRVPIVFIRDGRRVETLVRLAGVHVEDELLEKMAGALPPPPPRPERPERPGRPGGGPRGEEAPDGEGGGDRGDQGPNLDQAGGGATPAAVRELYTERRGYANYHFNREHQERLVEQLRAWAPGGDREPVGWRIRGVVDGGEGEEPIELLVTAEELALSRGDERIDLDSPAARFEAVDRQGAAALLAGLDAWRRLLVLGAQRFGDTYYEGQAPLLGRRPLRDVLVGTADELEVRWWLHPEAGQLEAIELVADRARDPAELHFRWDTAAQAEGPDAEAGEEEAGDGEASFGWPDHLELRFGTDSLLRIRVTRWESVAGQQG